MKPKFRNISQKTSKVEEMKRVAQKINLLSYLDMNLNSEKSSLSPDRQTDAFKELREIKVSRTDANRLTEA